MHHLNEIFYTVENEYAPLAGAGTPLTVRRRVAEALGDKLYISPALETASWCNESGYSVHLYLHSRAREEAGQEELSILPLVFGLPFAPEISGADFQVEQPVGGQVVTVITVVTVNTAIKVSNIITVITVIAVITFITVIPVLLSLTTSVAQYCQ